MDGLTEGRIVHFVLENGQHRPAIIVKVWNKESGYISLQVFTDGGNDGVQYASGIYWATSINPDEVEKKPRTWHWIEKA